MAGERSTAVVSDPPQPPNLPRDMLLEILKRLPAKSLMKFKCVSKDWFNIIHDSSFAESHLNHARTRPHASHLLFAFFPIDNLVQTIFPTYEDLSLSSQLPSHTFDHNFQPCSNVVNGLVCVCSVTSMQPRIWVLNLTTTQKKALPMPNLGKEFTFFPNFHRSVFFLGFDPVSKKYKILHHYKGAYEVLTLGSQTWRQVRGSATMEIDLGNGREGFIYQGFGHEGIAINGGIYFRIVNKIIAFFDLKDEKFGQLAIPESVEVDIHPYHLDIVDVGGKLAFVGGKFALVDQLGIWILEDDNNWVEKRLLTIPNNNLYVEFIGVTGNGEVLVNCKECSLNINANKYFYYDLKTLERTRIEITMQPHRDPLFYNYVENIVPL